MMTSITLIGLAYRYFTRHKRRAAAIGQVKP